MSLSAVAWLGNNNVDISCYRLIPYRLEKELFFNVEKILPITDYDDYYVNLMDNYVSENIQSNKKVIRRNLPKIDSMLKWGVVNEGDIIIAKGREDEGILLDNGNVKVNGEEKSMQVWLKELYGWSSVQTYIFAIHKETGKALSQIREEYMEEKENNTIDS